MSGSTMHRASRVHVAGHGGPVGSAVWRHLASEDFTKLEGRSHGELTRRFHEAKESAAPSVTLSGTGSPRREFLHVDDMANAALFLLESYDEAEHVNVGVGDDGTLKELAGNVARIVGYEGGLGWDTSKPDGMPRKLLDVTKINSLGWKAQIGLEEGISATYDWYVEQEAWARR
jgi:GDP-L-fucose synthase